MAELLHLACEILRLRRVAVAALFCTAAGIGSLSEVYELSEQVLLELRSPRSFFIA